MQYLYSDRIGVKIADITQLEVDAIVNAANSQLMGGGGVDGAIHKAGGPIILEECKKIRETKYPGHEGMPAGCAVVTTGGNLHAKKVIHTVGPVWQGGTKGEKATLAKAYSSSLEIASELGLKTIAFPAISTGVYGYPKKEAALVAYYGVKKFLDNNKYPEMVYFIFIDKKDADTFINAIDED
ncbi:MAG: O-acetyl-ADP-ribose deacetylase [Spirochaetaceae bacterium]|nr:O-acetyl-ADP-ribose deacetylase [Spirochaetaceae bacterium]